VVFIIVVADKSVELLLDILEVSTLLIDFGVDVFRLRRVTIHIVTNDQRVLQNAFLLFRKVFIHQLGNLHIDQVSVLLDDEFVTEHSLTLVSPEPGHGFRSAEHFRSRPTKSFVDSGKVSEVENVVELGGSPR